MFILKACYEDSTLTPDDHRWDVLDEEVCKACPFDHYNNVTVAEKFHGMCAPCADCKAINRETIQQCNSSSDAVCGNCLSRYINIS